MNHVWLVDPWTRKLFVYGSDGLCEVRHSFLLKMKSHICVRLGDRGYWRQRFSSLQTQRSPRCREKNSASPCPLRFMTSDREPLLLEPQRAPMKALPSNARLKLMSNPQNAFQSNYPVASPRKMAKSPSAVPRPRDDSPPGFGRNSRPAPLPSRPGWTPDETSALFLLLCPLHL